MSKAFGKADISIHLAQLVSQLPSNPGIYQFFNADGVIIYVGKAKSLKKRVSSYFNRDNADAGKVRILVSHVRDIKYVVVDSESDALFLENNLIKEYQPRYNILLKDDKTFPWICIKNESFPRIVSTRNLVDDGSEYFGPYTSGFMVKTLLILVRKLYPLRTCSLDLATEKIAEKRYKTCLEYHIGNCMAPCIGLQSVENYSIGIVQIKQILKGNMVEIISYLSKRMQDSAANLDFERALTIKSKLDVLKSYQSKTLIVNPSINNIDVFSLVAINDEVCVNFMRIAQGSIIQVHSICTRCNADETHEEVLATAIVDIREKLRSNSSEVLVNIVPEFTIDRVKYVVPKVGDKFKLVELSVRNATLFLENKIKLASLKSSKYVSSRENILETMKIDLRLSRLPEIIECFDNSNLQGTNPVAACVVFRNAKPAKSEYRHFNVKTVIGPDDFSSMREIVYRRYSRMLAERAQLPNLIVIDGGKGQLSAALESLSELNLIGKIEIIGIAKKLEEIFRPGDSVPLYIDKNSISLKVIQHIRNEAHRFGISFHRLKRSNAMMVSELDAISGIGERLKEVLLLKFKSVANIKNASLAEIAEVVGVAKAKRLVEAFGKKDL